MLSSAPKSILILDKMYNYVDDTCTVTVLHLAKVLSISQASKQYTLKVEEIGVLPILDTEITHQLAPCPHKVYRKTTQTTSTLTCNLTTEATVALPYIHYISEPIRTLLSQNIIMFSLSGKSYERPKDTS